MEWNDGNVFGAGPKFFYLTRKVYVTHFFIRAMGSRVIYNYSVASTEVLMTYWLIGISSQSCLNIRQTNVFWWIQGVRWVADTEQQTFFSIYLFHICMF